MPSNARIGLIGSGYIGGYIYDQITAHPEWGLEIAFIASRSPAPGALHPAPVHLRLDELASFASLSPSVDLVVEVAHPTVTVEHGLTILRSCDYMPLSLTALADPQLEAALREIARTSGTCLYIPHGAAVGLDSLAECSDLWDEVTVTMIKNPRNLDFAAAPHLAPGKGDDRERRKAEYDYRFAEYEHAKTKTPSPYSKTPVPRPQTPPSQTPTSQAPDPTPQTPLYDGPTRGLCALFPRNVNSHAAVALAGIGFDRTRSVLISDPTLEASVIRLEARGGGVTLQVERSNPLQGVSGVLTLRSILGCIQRAKAPRLHFQIC